MTDTKPQSEGGDRKGMKSDDPSERRNPTDRTRHHERADRDSYWRANLRLIAVLLTIWALVSFVFGILLIEQLNAWKIGSLPLGFWFAQQGSIYVFVILVFFYAWRMDRLDRKYGVDE